jgi:hypothetical protein
MSRQDGVDQDWDVLDGGVVDRVRLAVTDLIGPIGRRGWPVLAAAVVAGAAVMVGAWRGDPTDDPSDRSVALVAAAATTSAPLPPSADLLVDPGQVGAGPAPTLAGGDATEPGAEGPGAEGSTGSTASTPSTPSTGTVDEATTTGSTPSTVADRSSTTAGPGGATAAPARSGRSSTTGADTDTASTTGSRRTTTIEATTTTDRTATTARTTTTRQTTTTERATTTQRATTTAAPTTAGNSCASGAEFELVMWDDFNGSSVGGHWLQWNSAGYLGNGVRRSSALAVSNGRLIITAQMIDGTLVSGGINHRHAQTYGKYVFKVRTDVDPDRAMSGVVLTWPQSDAHPRDGENNIYETLAHYESSTRDPFYSFIHKPFGSASDQEYKLHRADAAQWQTMSMEWTPDRITITREGPGGGSWSDSWTVDETSADLIPDVAHQFHIQLDATKSAISAPVTMEVDYAGVYKYCG